MKVPLFRLVVGGLIMALTFAGLSMNTTIVSSHDLQRIESDDPTVIRTGTWTPQAASGASAGSYLYSSGAPFDVLQLAFFGPTIEILVSVGPTLGTLAIEVDGAVLRTVNTRAPSAAYQQSAKIDYLTAEAHTLRVYAPAGDVIAVDALVVALPDAARTTEVETTVVEQNTTPRLPCNPNAYPDSLLPLNPNFTDITMDGRYVIYAEQNAVGVVNVWEYDRLTCAANHIVALTDVTQGLLDQIGASENGQYIAVHLYYRACPGPLCAYIELGRRIDRTGPTPIVTSVQIQNGNPFSTMVGDISGDGRFFASPTYGDALRISDLAAGTSETVPTTQNYFYYPTISGEATFSTDGRYIGFDSSATDVVAGDTNGYRDAFLYDRVTATFSRVSVHTGGGQLASSSYFEALSSDGRFVLFSSGAPDIVPGDTNNATDLFLLDRQTLTVTLVSAASDGTVGNNWSGQGDLSGDGHVVVFRSTASNLVPNDTNGQADIFVHDTTSHITTLASISASAPIGSIVPANNASKWPDLSYDGRVLLFWSDASDIIPGVTGTNFLMPTTQFGLDRLALLDSANALTLYLNLADAPASNNYQSHALTPPANGQGVMGDWDGDGHDTPGVYAPDGVFYYTNALVHPQTWSAVWIGLLGRPAVAGRFNAGVNHDCIGAVDSANFPPHGTAFALYFACDLTPATAPPLTFQWLSVVLPDNQGHRGMHQFAAGDFDNDGVDSIAIRRGEFIAFTNIAPTTLLAEYNLAQYWATPPTTGGDYGLFAAGDFDLINGDSFGVYYANGNFYYRQSVAWNPNSYSVQHVLVPTSTVTSATTWR